MKFAVLFVMLLFSCASAHRVSPRDVSRASSSAIERDELVENLESEVNESNRLRGELGAVQKAEAAQKPTAVADEIGATPRLIVFTALAWCPPCRKLDTELKRLGSMDYKDAGGKNHTWSENIGPDAGKSIQVIDLSDENDDVSSALAVKYMVSALPTIVRINADGKQESRFSGWMTAETLCLYQSGKWKPPKPLMESRDFVSLID